MYLANPARYDRMSYRRCGASGLDLPLISLGLWQNFGRTTALKTQREIILAAFDAGVTHIDLANNYGPPPGAAETMFGALLKTDLAPYRDELVISTKAGYLMWPGPYGEWESASTSGTRWTPPCAGSAPTTWTSSTPTGSTRRRRCTRRWVH